MAETPTRPTPAPWTLREDDTFSTLGDKRIVSENLISPGIVFGGLGAETDANAALIVAACNACQQISEHVGSHPSPLLVAEHVEEIYHNAAALAAFAVNSPLSDLLCLKNLRAALASIETQETR